MGMSYLNFFDHTLLEFQYFAGYPATKNHNFLLTTRPQNFFHIFRVFLLKKS